MTGAETRGRASERDQEGRILGSVSRRPLPIHVNIIRLPLNQDFWFGCGGAGAATYTGAVQSIVNFCSQNNVYVLLDLHWSGTSSTSSAPCGSGWGNDSNTKQQPMADANAITFLRGSGRDVQKQSRRAF